MDVERFKKKVEDWWKSFVIQGRPDYILACKLKLLNTKLKVMECFYGGNLKKKKTNLLSQTLSMDLVQEQTPLNEDEVLEKASLQMEFQVQRLFWFQEEEILNWSNETLVVKSIYLLLFNLGQSTRIWPWRYLWKVKAPFKVICFSWLVAREAYLTQEI